MEAAFATVVAAASEPAAKKPKISAADDLRETLKLLGERKEEFVDSSPDAQRAAFFKAVIGKIVARRPHENIIRLRCSEGDYIWDNVASHRQFITDIMELRGWKLTDWGSNVIVFELKSMHSDARALALELGWI